MKEHMSLHPMWLIWGSILYVCIFSIPLYLIFFSVSGLLPVRLDYSQRTKAARQFLISNFVAFHLFYILLDLLGATASAVDITPFWFALKTSFLLSLLFTFSFFLYRLFLTSKDSNTL